MSQRIYVWFLEASVALWQWLRGASGEHAYERYLRHAAKHGEAILTPQQFYLENGQRKAGRQSRCC
jgi:hypothetical protein